MGGPVCCKYVDPQTGTRCRARLETAGEWGCEAHILQAPPEVLQTALAMREARREKKRLTEATKSMVVLARVQDWASSAAVPLMDGPRWGPPRLGVEGAPARVNRALPGRSVDRHWLSQVCGRAARPWFLGEIFENQQESRLSQ